MNTETHTEPQVNIKRKYFIVFNNDNGKILRINSTKVTNIANNTTQAESTDPICKKLINGTSSLKKYGMIWDLINHKWELSHRGNVLIIESDDNKLVPFAKDVAPSSVDLYVNIFYNSNQILVTANMPSIRKNKNLATISEISLNETNALDIHITRKNDPDYLVHTLKLDPKELFTHGQQIITLDKNIDKELDWNNISLYSKHVFNNYGWSLTELKIENQRNEHVLQTSAKTNEPSHININVVDNRLIVSNNLSIADKHLLSGIKLFKFIVCNETPDVFVGAIQIERSQFENKTFEIEINFDWPDTPLLVHKYNNIEINLGEQ